MLNAILDMISYILSLNNELILTFLGVFVVCGCFVIIKRLA